ncbi:ATP-dependent 6-phosphofructokinase [Bacteroidales bacterium OttesenSCG-928-B11]|nr:ATP-dependent 6-phosphofructokinase [Bacteroidales bacterium OttesenSCG-928-E04]MDL2308441.1 ATP-dependent 6-phosphofructokinase [Bacteroidales bacterium OttesenSCG-928-C03]MDL2311306.1 ATP-dependent 6-phosphofructokinase [Bacteroidales bacterium OttesenSCG-928-B11]MDL2326032.1 ATP-dependent 6-phosphofructokinase [Bacteroidales bacterium OttesenSCG-928-A14]
MAKRILVATGGGDCPGLNAVLRGIVKRAHQEGGWEVFGCIESFNGILKDNIELIQLTSKTVSGLHVKGGTIIKTINRGGPFHFPVQLPDGTWITEDRSELMKRRLENLGIDAVINIGGDGSQRISVQLENMGINVVGVPKTIDNDLASTDFTFGFQTAVQIATEAFDKLVTTAESHNRIFIMEVMGRDAGWIALHSAIAGGADVCLIPEIPYDPVKVAEKIATRYRDNEGFCNIVIAEGAVRKDGTASGSAPVNAGDPHFKLHGAGDKLRKELEDLGVEHDIRVTVLGHLQRGGTPIAFDRIIATAFGVKAFELVKDQQYGQMVVYRQPKFLSVPLTQAISKPNLVDPNTDHLIHTAKGMGMSFGD